MLRALEYRQAVVMRANIAGQHMVAIEQQVVSRDGSGNIGRCRLHEVDRITGGYVL